MTGHNTGRYYLFLMYVGLLPSTLYIRYPDAWNWGANNRTGKAGALFLGGGMRSARLTDNRIVLPRRTGVYTANEGSFTKLGPRHHHPPPIASGRLLGRVS
jgi:hypothetical protein